MNGPKLPIKRSLCPFYRLSLVIGILMAGASLAGVIFQPAMYASEDLRRSFVSNDVVNLLIGLPILLGSIGLARRGRWIGLLFMPGALFYIFYNYAIYALAMPLTWQFVPFLVLAFLSAYAMIGVVTSMDAPAIQMRLRGAVPERLTGGVLAGFGTLFFIWRGLLVLQTLTGQAALPTAELSTATVDLIITPVWITGGVLLWRRQAFGYVGGAGLLFQTCMLFIGLLVFFILQPFVVGAPFPIDDFVVILSMGLICFVPFGLFVRGVLSIESKPFTK